MKRIVVLVEGYINQTEANAICLKKIVKEMEKTVRVDIISIERNFSGGNGNVYAINKSKIILKREFIRKFVKFIHMPVENKKLTKLIAKETNCLLDAKAYDALIAIVNPTEVADALGIIRKKKPSLNVILYEIDPASNRYKNPKNIVEKLWRERAILWEKKIYNYCTTIVHMKTHKRHFSQDCFKKFKGKTIYLDIPNFEVDILPYKRNDKYVMVYAGAFYPNLRNPFPMINILKKLSRQLPIEVYIYTGSNMIEDIRKSVLDYKEFHVHNFVSQDVLREEFIKADVLLDLGNTDSDYLPSKPFQYMGTGKPIIHFKPDDADVSVEYLNRYENALIVPIEGTKYKVDEIAEFLKRQRRREKLYDKETLTRLFYENTPQCAAKKILEILNC